jgi:hypothetical protein
MRMIKRPSLLPDLVLTNTIRGASLGGERTWRRKRMQKRWRSVMAAQQAKRQRYLYAIESLPAILLEGYRQPCAY